VTARVGGPTLSTASAKTAQDSKSTTGTSQRFMALSIPAKEGYFGSSLPLTVLTPSLGTLMMT
jgi:hypothetical protein